MRAERSAAQLTMIEPTTAISAPGIFLLISRQPTITVITQAEVTTVQPLASGMLPSAVKNFRIVPPVPSETPSMPATWPIATWMPTPVRKPISTERERKSATNPSRSSRARSRIPAVISASIPASATYCGEATAAMPARPAAMIAAVAESAPTTRWRDEPSTAKSAIGSRIV